MRVHDERFVEDIPIHPQINWRHPELSVVAHPISGVGTAFVQTCGRDAPTN